MLLLLLGASTYLQEVVWSSLRLRLWQVGLRVAAQRLAFGALLLGYVVPVSALQGLLQVGARTCAWWDGVGRPGTVWETGGRRAGPGPWSIVLQVVLSCAIERWSCVFTMDGRPLSHERQNAYALVA